MAVLAIGGLAFGVIRGQDRQWQGPVAWVALVIGVIAMIAFPILMARRPQPTGAARAVPTTGVRDY